MKKLAIEDRIKLEDLIANYAWSLDTGDTEGMVACFTEDCVVTEAVFEDPDIWPGHQGIRDFAEHYFGAPGFAGRQHHVTQIQYIPVTDTCVKMRSFAFVTECEGEPPYVLRFTGWYDDEAVKQPDGEWLFSRRTIRLWDGEVLEKFPGKGDWVPRKRPDSLKLRK